jgi:hypothetical protein
MLCTPKKTVEQIIVSGNDYLIAVKPNQLKLFNEIAHQFEQAPVLSIQSEDEKTRDRQTRRTVMVINTVGRSTQTGLGCSVSSKSNGLAQEPTSPMKKRFFTSVLCA